MSDRIVMVLRQYSERSVYRIEASVRGVLEGKSLMEMVYWVDSVDGLYLDDLELSCQGNLEEPPSQRSLYAIRLQYKPYKVEAFEALKMAHTFQKIDKKMYKLIVRFGFPRTYTDHFRYLVEVLGYNEFYVVGHMDSKMDRQAAISQVSQWEEYFRNGKEIE